MIPVAVLTLRHGISTPLPALANDDSIVHPLQHPGLPSALSAKELKKYKGFNDFLRARNKNSQLASKHKIKSGLIRAAFYVDWDPQAFFSLQKNIDQLNMVFPEWLFIDPRTDTLQVKIDSSALAVMQSTKIKILPLSYKAAGFLLSFYSRTRIISSEQPAAVSAVHFPVPFWPVSVPDS